jgi:hypothetical protein
MADGSLLIAHHSPLVDIISFMDNEIELYDEVPQPPENVKLEALLARVYPDGRRVRLGIKVTPFLERPNIEVFIFNSEGQEVSSMSIVESLDHNFELTAHLRGPQPHGRYTLRGELFYGEDPAAPRQTLEVFFEVP